MAKKIAKISEAGFVPVTDYLAGSKPLLWMAA
jgi:hypothetical protein